MTGVVIPPDAKNFLVQARQQGFKPKVISIGKALLFPTSIEALGDLGDGLSTEVWWSPSHPFKSSLTGQSARQLADAYEARTSKQWTQPIGFAHALFEIAVDALKRAKDIDSNEAIRDAVASTKLDTRRRPRRLGQRPGEERREDAARRRAVAEDAAGQTHRFDLAIVNNQLAPSVPLSGPLKLIA